MTPRPPRVDLVGQRFGRLLASEWVGNSRWRCACDCGSEATVFTNKLRSGATRSCGCLRADTASALHSRPACGVCGYERATGADCARCARRRNAEYKTRNSEKVAASRSAYRKAKHAAGATERADKKAQRDATRPLRRRAAKQRWKAENRGATNEATARRFAAKMRATPAWADRSLMKDFYALASIYAAELGSSFHVDHIVPLRSPLVCGLHAPSNLNVLPGSENISKSNRHWPDMP